MRGPVYTAGAIVLFLLVLRLSCSSGLPREPGDICSIFKEKRSWYRATKASHEKWGVPEPVQIAIIRRESSFRDDARPPRKRYLGFIPGPRPTSAFGYGQVLDGTWKEYQEHQDRPGAERSDFKDVTDFIGWYAEEYHRRTGLAKDDTFNLYLAYHEGIHGFQHRSYDAKPWLVKLARKVDAQAETYAAQLDACRDDLEGGWFW